MTREAHKTNVCRNILEHVNLNSESEIHGELCDDVYSGASIDGTFMCNIASKLVKRYIVYIPYKCCLYYGQSNRKNDVITLKYIDLLCNGVNIFRKDESVCIQSKCINMEILFQSKYDKNIWYNYISKSIKDYKIISKNKNGIIDGLLYKFRGNKLTNIQFDKKYIKTKYVIYLKSKQLLIYCDNNNKNIKMIKVNSISTYKSNLKCINQKMPYKYKDIWFKIKTNKRIIIFGTKNYNDIKYWFTNINHSLTK